MAIRRPPTTFSDTISTADIADDAIITSKIADDQITGALLANDIAISTTGNIATTGSGTLTVAGNTTLSGTNNLGSNPTITLGSNATFPDGIIVNTEAVQNSTRTTVSSSSSTDREILAIGNYNKLYSSTDLIIHVFSPADNGNLSGKVGIGLKYGSSSTQWGGYFAHIGNTHATILISYLYLTGHTTTGSQSISLRSGAANSADATPCDFLNPNSNDDARNHQTITTAIVYEVQT